MDDFGILARDFGFRPQGKSAPMKSDGADFRSRPPSSSSPFAADENQIFNDVFGGLPKFTNSNSRSTKTMSDIDYDSIFKNSTSTNSNDAKSKSTSSKFPVYDKPIYDDDIFDGLPGMKSKSLHSASARYEDNIFASMAASPPKGSEQIDHFDDLLGNLSRGEKVEQPIQKASKSPRGLDDLLPGFGSSGPPSNSRAKSDSVPVSTGKPKETSNPRNDPFVVLESASAPVTSSQGVFINPLEMNHNISKSGSTNVGVSSVSKGLFDNIDPLHVFGKPAPAFPSEANIKGKDRSPSRRGSVMDSSRSSTRRDQTEKSSFKYSESQSQKVPVDKFQESPQTFFDIPTLSKNSSRSGDHTTSPPSYTETSSQADMSPTTKEHVQPADDIWLTVSEIPLLTHPTRAPPPSRPPPSIPAHSSKSERGYFASNTRTVGNDYFASNSANNSQSSKLFQPAAESPMASPLDELENFAMGGIQDKSEENADAQYGEEMDSNSAAAAAMKDAMDRAEAKFRQAKEVREREHAKASRSKESVKLQRDEMSMEEESKHESQERECQQREREEQEREKSRLEKERMRETERERARQAVERATREARERAASEARERASAEARLKVERAAVQRAQAEARERAAIDAKERAERAAAEAREKVEREKAAVARAEADARRRAARAAVERVNAEARERLAAEAREKAEREKAAVAMAEAARAAVEKVNAEARERLAAEAREKAEREKAAVAMAEAARAAVERVNAAARERAAARMSQQKNDNDLESFFSMGSRPSSAPRPRAASSDPALDPLSQNRRGQDGAQRTSTSGLSSTMRKASSTTNIVDDLNSIFGAAPSFAGEFQDVEGETEERRRARMERQQRTQERAAKALAEKNQRDFQSQREQEERNRIGETMDAEIKRWAAGKEGNLRALLSTLQYVLWPACGWQPVSLTDLITGANVKKAYRKATLCIHPDKVQQKGANLQQKYVAEKVFDLLKEAWNKFNSEELF